MKNISLKFLLSVLILSTISCSKDDDNKEPEVLSTENRILNFQLPIHNSYISGEIDEVSKIISFNTEGADLKELTPKISFSDKATINPSEDEPQDFSSEVAYTVYAENGSTEVYRVQVNNRPLSAEKKILSFVVNIEGEDIEAEINHEQREVYIDVGEHLDQINPVISVSEYASINILDESPDFSGPVSYEVTAEDGSSVTYELQVNKPRIGIARSIAERLFFYPGAEFMVSGRFLDIEEDHEFYLIDEGGNKVIPQITKQESYSYGYEETFNSWMQIPFDTPTGIYKLVIELDHYSIEHEGFDILAEDTPRVTSTDKAIYEPNDTLVLTGENLKPYIIIPADGSQYIIFNTHNIDLEVNEEGTELRFVMDYQWNKFFYHNVVRKIYLIDENRRVGESIEAIFK